MIAYRTISTALLLMVTLGGQGCSFHSNQWQFLKGLFEDQTNLLPRATWLLNWGEIRAYVYAIPVDDRILFTDGSSVVVSFQGAQVIRVEDVAGRVEPIEISLRENNLEYRDGGKLVAIDRCAEWRLLGSNEYPGEETVSGQKGQRTNIYAQTCNQDAYTNRIMRDDMGRLIGLEFRLLPQRELLRLNYAGVESNNAN